MASCWKGFFKKGRCKFASVDKVMVMLQCKCKSWRSFITKISGDATSWQTWILPRLQYKWSVAVASWKRWMLARLQYKWSVVVASWQKWSDDVTLWLHECWHSFGANGALTWLHECWHGFNTNEVLLWLHGKDGCWHDFDATEVLTWLHGKDECWCGLTINEALTWLHVEKASLKRTSANFLQ